MSRISILAITLMMVSCAGEKSKEEKDNASSGIGEVKEVLLKTPLESDKVERGSLLFEGSCSTCHKLTRQKLVGPGWKDITRRRKPEWIMNMITNVSIMLDKDPEAQKLFEMCLVRMPRQNITLAQARDILEFMRSNDGVR